MSLIAYVARIGFVYNLKVVNDEAQNKIIIQREELRGQNDEISKKSDALKLSHDNLIAANEVIQRQKRDLEKMVDQKTKHLMLANKELMLQKNELTQFSFALLHNLKSTVASLKGLMSLLDQNQLNESILQVCEYIDSTIQHMSELFEGLNEIIELRSNLYQLNTHFCFKEEFENVVNLLKKQVLQTQAEIKLNNHADHPIFTNKNKIGSILLYLISNSLKYSSPECKPRIEVSFREIGDTYHLTVKDNGLGIDPDKHQQKIFQLFQRFQP
ncbi:MAG TPA: hypothetical protein DDY13_02990 [Cytophagales bacterium]|jgi:light-regulated signal transduction histidine kinase (bacteriophytochrome)|nr:hypothetical protein [Cytophagales bacterium]